MKIDRSYRLDNIVSPDSNRYGLTAVHVDRGTDGMPLLVCTNGSALIAIKAGELDAHDTGDYIAPEVFDAIRKSTTAREPVADVSVNGSAVVNGTKMRGATFSTPDLKAKDFPDWRQVMPKADRKTTRVCLDPVLLAQLVAAMGSPKGIILEIGDPLDPVIVKPETANDVHVAVIMPRRID